MRAGSGIGDEGAEALATALARCPGIRFLYVGDNNLGLSVGVKALERVRDRLGGQLTIWGL